MICFYLNRVKLLLQLLLNGKKNYQNSAKKPAVAIAKYSMLMTFDR